VIVVVAVVALWVAVKVGWPLAIPIVVGSWLAHSWYYPLTGCWWCKEKSKRRNKSGQHWHACLVCGGSGKRRRFGAKLLGRGLGNL
jgi:hypothetical protein